MSHAVHPPQRQGRDQGRCDMGKRLGGLIRIQSKRKSTVPVMTQKWHADAPRGHHHVRGLESQTPFRHGRRRLRAPR